MKFLDPNCFCKLYFGHSRSRINVEKDKIELEFIFFVLSKIISKRTILCNYRSNKEQLGKFVIGLHYSFHDEKRRRKNTNLLDYNSGPKLS